MRIILFSVIFVLFGCSYKKGASTIDILVKDIQEAMKSGRVDLIRSISVGDVYTDDFEKFVMVAEGAKMESCEVLECSEAKSRWPELIDGCDGVAKVLFFCWVRTDSQGRRVDIEQIFQVGYDSAKYHLIF